MIKTELKLQNGGEKLHVYLFKPDNLSNIRGIVQIAHGAAEYGARYEAFARFLTSHGYLVCANDHRGHGFTAKSKAELGFFCDSDGWNAITQDLYAVTRFLKDEYKGKDIVLLGHSMGSFLARTYAVFYGGELKGMILSGTAHNPKPLLMFGRFVAELDIKNGKQMAKNRLLNKLAFDDLNKGLWGETGKEWLSRDPGVVSKYVNDWFCGFDFSSSAFRDLFSGLLYITDRKNIVRTPKELPILILAGKDDPVGGKGKMVMKCVNGYKKAGVKIVSVKLYDGMRHEILNEVGKEEVYNDILNWLNGIIKKEKDE